MISYNNILSSASLQFRGGGQCYLTWEHTIENYNNHQFYLQLYLINMDSVLRKELFGKEFALFYNW
jgi:hypothetical protein